MDSIQVSLLKPHTLNSYNRSSIIAFLHVRLAALRHRLFRPNASNRQPRPPTTATIDHSRSHATPNVAQETLKVYHKRKGNLEKSNLLSEATPDPN
jgi:hypothetical protein